MKKALFIRIFLASAMVLCSQPLLGAENNSSYVFPYFPEVTVQLYCIQQPQQNSGRALGNQVILRQIPNGENSSNSQKGNPVIPRQEHLLYNPKSQKQQQSQLTLPQIQYGVSSSNSQTFNPLPRLENYNPKSQKQQTEFEDQNSSNSFDVDPNEAARRDLLESVKNKTYGVRVDSPELNSVLLRMENYNSKSQKQQQIPLNSSMAETKEFEDQNSRNSFDDDPTEVLRRALIDNIMKK